MPHYQREFTEMITDNCTPKLTVNIQTSKNQTVKYRKGYEQCLFDIWEKIEPLFT
jgi:hypothetical protein